MSTTSSYSMQALTWGKEEIAAVIDCLDRRQTTMGDKVCEFEQAFAEYIGTSHAVMVNSGASANLLIMWAARELGILHHGDEVICPAVTWPTQVSAVIEAGFHPRLADVEVSTLNVSLVTLNAALTPRTRAVSLVHLMGNPSCTPEIIDWAERCGLHIFEDCCEALGATVGGYKTGSFSTAAAFSFFQSHHLTTMEGGMITTGSLEFANKVRMLRAHGWTRDQRDIVGLPRDPSRFKFIGPGFNFRPTELNAAFGLVQLGKLSAMNSRRDEHALQVQLLFRSTNGHFVESLLPTHWQAEPSWFALPFVLREGLPYSRERVIEYLEDNGAETRPIAGGNLARQPGFSKMRDWTSGNLPGADAIHDRGFYIALPAVETNMRPVIELLNSCDSHLRH